MTNHYQKDCRRRNDRSSTTKRKSDSPRNSTGKKARSDKDRNSRDKACFLASPKQPKVSSKIIRINNQDRDVSKHPVQTTISEIPEKEAWSAVNSITVPHSDVTNSKNYADFAVDSGATGHMTNDINILTKTRQSTTKINIAEKGRSIPSTSVGTVKSKNCDLKTVYFVPELSRNLLSVSEVTNKDASVIFNKHEVKVIDSDMSVPENKIILKGSRTQSGLYVINFPVEGYVKENNVNVLSAVVEQNLINWHRKMGHMSLTKLKQLPHLCNGIKLKSLKHDLNIVCTICTQAKQVKLPHNTVRQKATRVLQIIHTDVGGQITPPTHDGYNYFVVFIDDYSHFCKVYLMAYKSEVFEHLKAFILESENHHQLKVSKIRSDNGGEYISHKLKGWCKSKGITLDYTVPRCPQLNGTAERMIRTLLEKTRALLFDSGLNDDMWGEALQTAAYLINRSPTSTVSKLPAEIWLHRKPDLSNIHLFGTRVFSKVTTYLKKLDSRSREAIFIGYASNGYRLWNPETEQVYVSHDVVFTDKLAKTDRSPQRQIKIVMMDNKQKLLFENPQQPLGNPAMSPIPNIDEDQQLSPGTPNNSPQHRDDTPGQGYNLRDRSQIHPPKKHEDYVALMTTENTLTYADCMKDPNWREAIKEEIDSLNKNNVWDLVPKSQAIGKETVSSRWVFKIKDNGDHKARLVARGCEQGDKIDFKETYSPVVDTTNLRVLLALASQSSIKIKTFDVKTAFLNGTLDQEVYMKLPEGLNETHKICLLKKALYGLKQAPLRWHKRLTEFLNKKGIEQLKTDKCIFKNKANTLHLAVHVDDGIIIGSNIKAINKLIKNLQTEFEIKVDHDPKSYLGMEITKTDKGIILSQSHYAKKVLEKFGMSDCHPAPIPLEPKGNLPPDPKPKNTNFPYREVLGSLQYLACKTRPDIAFAVNYASRYVENPTNKNIKDVTQLLRYLKGTVNTGICYYSTNQEELIYKAYSDSDYAGSGPEGKMKSTSGHVIMLSNGPVTWCSHKQSVVATSTTEAEYIAAAECTKELQYLKTLISELTGKAHQATLNVDNQSSIKLIKSGQLNRRSKHINVRYFFISEALDNGIFSLEYCPSDEQLADILTKPLQNIKFTKFKNSLCVTL